MTNNLNIDVSKGKLDQKEKGSLLPIECKSIEETRRYNLERLASGFRMFAHFGFDEGIAGHITYRDPEHEDHFWVNPFGMHFNQICVSDLILVNKDGEVVLGDKPVNTAAFAIHSSLHDARPDVNAAAHSHSMYGKTFSTLGKMLDPISQDSCAFYERTAIFADYDGVANGPDEGINIAKALGDKEFCILQNHGILTTGSMVDTAVWYFLNMEDACKSQLLAEAVGKPKVIPHDTACATRDYVANDLSAFVSFQPTVDVLWEEEPDLLD